MKLKIIVGILFIAIGIFSPSSIYQIVVDQPEESHWTRGTSMLTARSEIAGAVLNDRNQLVLNFAEMGVLVSIKQIYTKLI